MDPSQMRTLTDRAFRIAKSKQVFTLGEFLEQKAPDFKIPQLKRKAIVHGTATTNPL